ncbi:MAG TPA: hypothetical protein VMR51_02205 [Patescibacteria group bacterium]|nr:hypothetical protein [Patescibacteria group bacterium]
MVIWLAVIIGILLVIVAGAWFIFRPKKKATITDKLLSNVAEHDVEHIFDDEFREELRNRGRLHFEKIIGENAMFLQQDLRLTTSQLNDYMKDEIKKVLQEEFAKYEESISTAKDLAMDTIQKTQDVIEQQRLVLEKQMTDEVSVEKTRVIEHFEKNMADIVNHYILAAIGNEIDLTDQLDYIFQYLEENKAAIIEDIRSGT